MKKVGFFILFSTLMLACKREATLDSWTLNLAILGSNSSPKCTDLNGDGIEDIVLGVSRNEFEYTHIGVLAVNGKNGDTLWTTPASDQIYGSPLFMDVNGDKTPDVFITGRDKNLMCLDGTNGKLIWKYKVLANDYTPKGLARFNFYNPRFIKDISGDGLEDLLVLNSGNVDAVPYDTLNRHPGVLMVVNAKSGDIITLDTMPDGKESYMSPVVHHFGGEEESLIFGTGGETVSGNLYTIPLKAFIQEGLNEAEILETHLNQHGFIAPPIIADFNGDHIADLLALNHGGVVTLHDGANNFSAIWNTTLPSVELNAQATIGYFNDDDILDIFINGALGQWPQNTGSKQFFMDGKDGSVIKTYEIGCSGFSSPLTMNVDSDKLDEALLYINDFDCRRYNTMFNLTSMYIFGVDTMSQFDKTSMFGKNISSTPWIGDLDGDKKLDMISVIAENTKVFHEFLGFKVIRNEYDFNPENLIKWPSYMGENNKCTYEF